MSAIAGNKNLLRPCKSNDRAFVRVLGILSVWIRDHCTPFMFVKFFQTVRSLKIQKNSRYLLDSVETQEPIFVGEHGSMGAALYPVSCLMAPALLLSHNNSEHLILPLKFFTRSRWLDEGRLQVSETKLYQIIIEHQVL